MSHTFPRSLRSCLGFWLLIGTWEMRKEIALLLAAAFVPATWIVWMITDHFQAGVDPRLGPGWLQSDPAFSDPTLFASALGFWWENFGLLLPAMIVLVGLVCWRFRKRSWRIMPWKSGLASLLSALGMLSIFGLFVFMADDPGSPSNGCPWLKLSFLVAFVVFAGLTITALRQFEFCFRFFRLRATSCGDLSPFAIFVKTAPWGWDNTKLIIWAYFICAILWRI